MTMNPVSRLAATEQADALKREAAGLKSRDLRGDSPAWLELLLQGYCAPLAGYMGSADCAAVLAGQRLADGRPWPVPVDVLRQAAAPRAAQIVAPHGGNVDCFGAGPHARQGDAWHVDERQWHGIADGVPAHSPASGSRRVVGALLMDVAAFLFAGTWGAYRRDTGIVRAGAVADAEIIKAGHPYPAAGESQGLVYRFRLPDGRTIERHWTSSDPQWQNRCVGDRLRVHYDAGNPSRNFPEGGVASLGMSLFAALFALMALVLGGMLALGGRRQ